MIYPNIEAERVRNGMDKKSFASVLGVSASTLKNWQSGKTEIPASKLVIMASEFGVTTDYLLGRSANSKERKIKNWVSVNLPEDCPNVCISFKREIAEMQIKKFGAKPLYGFNNGKEDWLPVQVFITYGGTLAPDQRCPEA